MAPADSYDALVIGGGPAGSTAARRLVAAGLRVLVLDQASFPRVKLCAGWLSEPVWDALELSPSSYPRGLWPWERCHVHHRGRTTTVRARGYFIRRYEFDDYLLATSGAEIARHRAQSIERDGRDWVVDERYRAPYLIGAGGTHCPVARMVAPPRSERPVGVQELELQTDPAAVADCRVGADGEPELLLHDDFGGYSWNVPKTDWLNVGSGTMNAKAVRSAWAAARRHFEDSGHLPVEAAPRLEREAKGHSYYLFDPLHLERCEQGGAFLVGDALGLAQPLTAEGILPAVISGRLCADAILAGDPAGYRPALAAHPVLADYDLLYRLRMAAYGLRQRAPARSRSVPLPEAARGVSARALAHGFGWLFAGRPVPGGRVLRKVMGAMR